VEGGRREGCDARECSGGLEQRGGEREGDGCGVGHSHPQRDQRIGVEGPAEPVRVRGGLGVEQRECEGEERGELEAAVGVVPRGR
jgi:hypothetical protein